MSPRSSRATVDLPEPGLADEAERLAAPDLEATRPRRRGASACATRRCRARGSPSRGRRRRAGLRRSTARRGTTSCAWITPAVARDSSTKWQATRPAGSARSKAGRVGAADLPVAGEPAARREAAAGRNRVRAGQHAGDRRQRRRRARRRAAARRRSAPACTGGRRRSKTSSTGAVLDRGARVHDEHVLRRSPR